MPGKGRERVELVKNAWLGWQNYITHGKLAALFLLAAIYLLVRHWKQDKIKQIAGYGIVMAVICIFPLTAALLMCYQTRFYDYEWIWSMAPVTVLIALGGTWLVIDQKRKNVNLNNICHYIFLAGMLAAMLLLCGRLGAEPYERRQADPEYGEVEAVLADMTEQYGEGNICLWAPREILEYARVLDGGVSLLYGRNMWDISLDAYSYDSYPPETRDLYLWMEQMTEDGKWIRECGPGAEATGSPGLKRLTGDEQIQYALQAGANCILLKDNLTTETRAELEKAIAANNLQEALLSEGYCLLMAR